MTIRRDLPVRWGLGLLLLPVGLPATLPIPAVSQERSPVLKDRSADRSPFYLRRDRSTAVLFDAFMLSRKASGGDAPAQHELGLRYLQGLDFGPDTAQAAGWIARAAEQEYLPAVYNLGILKYNGWGVAWDPFGAYRNFKRAAESLMPEGMYMFGVLHTDDLAVRRDYREAWRWIRSAADSGYSHAIATLEEFRKTGLLARIHADTDRAAGGEPSAAPGDAARTAPPAVRTWSPVFIDFDTDTPADPDDSTLAAEARGLGDSTMTVAPSAGAPEALTWLGRRAETGAGGGTADRIGAAFLYLAATRNESRRAPILLWRLASSRPLYDDLASAVGRGETRASYVWAALVARGFDARLTPEQALSHLRRAARAGIADAMLELASWHQAGSIAHRDDRAADSLVALAARSGNREAGVRSVMSSLRKGDGGTGSPVSLPEGALDSLVAAERDGSLLAQAIIGRCYETGTGLEADLSLAVAFYRKAARRGSRFAYDALRALYDERRPGDPEFSVDAPRR